MVPIHTCSSCGLQGRKVVVFELSIDAHTYVSRLLTAYVLLNLVAYSC